jgi:hypothetical protein
MVRSVATPRVSNHVAGESSVMSRLQPEYVPEADNTPARLFVNRPRA